MNLFGKRKLKKVSLSQLMGESVKKLEEKEMEQIYGGCSINYSPIAPISENIIFDKYNSNI